MLNKKIYCFHFGKYFNSIWCSLFLFCLFLMMGAQLALTTPAARNMLSTVNDIETLGGQQEDGFKLGEITLSLVSIEPSKDIKILLNGQVIALFVQKQINITVCNNALLEIDGTAVKDPFTVKIDNVPSNISFADGKNIAEIQSNIGILARIFVK